MKYIYHNIVKCNQCFISQCVSRLGGKRPGDEEVGTDDSCLRKTKLYSIDGSFDMAEQIDVGAGG